MTTISNMMKNIQGNALRKLDDAAKAAKAGANEGAASTEKLEAAASACTNGANTLQEGLKGLEQAAAKLSANPTLEGLKDHASASGHFTALLANVKDTLNGGGVNSEMMAVVGAANTSGGAMVGSNNPSDTIDGLEDAMNEAGRRNAEALEKFNKLPLTNPVDVHKEIMDKDKDDKPVSFDPKRYETETSKEWTTKDSKKVYEDPGPDNRAQSKQSALMGVVGQIVGLEKFRTQVSSLINSLRQTSDTIITGMLR